MSSPEARVSLHLRREDPCEFRIRGNFNFVRYCDFLSGLVIHTGAQFSGRKSGMCWISDPVR
jgi:hypothetical protein